MKLDQRQLAERLLAQAKEQRVELAGPNGFLNQSTKNVLETGACGDDRTPGLLRHDPLGAAGQLAYRHRAKTVLPEIEPGRDRGAP